MLQTELCVNFIKLVFAKFCYMIMCVLNLNIVYCMLRAAVHVQSRNLKVIKYVTVLHYGL